MRATSGAPKATHAKRVGLARALSKLGYCSRSQASELIRAGRVRLNGLTRRDPETPVCIGSDRIEVNSATIARKAKIYIMLNKPRGLVTTASDEQGRDTIYSCLNQDLPWLAPVGRLDKASEGLLLLTNDSEWAARITAPESHVPKTYHVQIVGLKDASFAEALVKGVRVPEFGVMRAASAQIIRRGERNTWIEIVLDEGKNRQIRRMLSALGVEVLRLVRVAIGSLAMGDLPKAAHRALSAKEKASLDVRPVRPV
jgi:23S rRNA pseudouridine2605 synthase